MSRLTKLTLLGSISLIAIAVALSVIALVPVNAAPGDFDVDGRDLLLDADGDTLIDANTDDVINITVGGTTLYQPIVANTTIHLLDRIPSDETRNSNTLSNSALSFTTEANGIYSVKFVLLWTAGASIQNGLFNVTVPSGAIFDGLICAEGVSGATNNCVDMSEAASQSVLTGTEKTITITGRVRTGATTGSVTLQWAQATTDAGNPHTLYIDSYLEYAKFYE